MDTVATAIQTRAVNERVYQFPDASFRRIAGIGIALDVSIRTGDAWQCTAITKLLDGLQQFVVLVSMASLILLSCSSAWLRLFYCRARQHGFPYSSGNEAAKQWEADVYQFPPDP